MNEVERVLNQAKVIAYSNVYIPRRLRGKIEVVIKDGTVTIKKKEK